MATTKSTLPSFQSRYRISSALGDGDDDGAAYTQKLANERSPLAPQLLSCSEQPIGCLACFSMRQPRPSALLLIQEEKLRWRTWPPALAGASSLEE